jgi:acetyl esterase/lipase
VQSSKRQKLRKLKKLYLGVALVVLLLATVIIGITCFQSRSLPGTISIISNWNYGTNAAQEFDIYVPHSISLSPLIILVHGGAWEGGDKSDLSGIAYFLAEKGFVVINMNYRLLPDFSYPAPMEDIQMVLQWVNQNAENYGIDTTRIGMCGYSAGGHLVALYSLTQDKNYINGGSMLPRVYAIAALAGVFTLQGINNTTPIVEDTLPVWLATANPQSLGLPIDQIEPGDNVTFLLLQGAQDVIAPPAQSSLFYHALVANGVSAELKIYPDKDHTTLISGIPNDDEVGQDLVSFFNETLNSP